MARRKSEQLTPLELEIMNVLWETGAANVQTVQQGLKRELAYTTVQTMVRRLEEKGAVRQTKQIGNAHIFEPLVTREAVHKRLIDELLDLLGGSARPLMAHLAEAGKLSLEDVREIETMLSDQEAEGSPPGETKASKRGPARPRSKG